MPGGLLPASMPRRVVARGLDLLMMVIVFCVVFAPCVVAIGAWTMQSMLASHSREEAAGGFVVAAVVVSAIAAVLFEPVRQSGWHSTFGRSRARVKLVRCERPCRAATTGRVMARWGISMAACCAAILGAVALAAVADVAMSPVVVLGLVALPVLLVWVSTLLTAAVRADRRGWHDVAARTMLVAVVDRDGSLLARADGALRTRHGVTRTGGDR